MLAQILWVGAGGFLGAVSRFGMNSMLRGLAGHFFPLHTLAVNTLGCLAAGVLFEYLRGHPLLPTFTLFLVIGFLGSFTTFSAFSLETMQLVRGQAFHLAFMNIVLNLGLCLLAVFAGSRVGNCLR